MLHQSSSERPSQGKQVSSPARPQGAVSTAARVSGSTLYRPKLWLCAQTEPARTWSEQGRVRVWAAQDADGVRTRTDACSELTAWLGRVAGVSPLEDADLQDRPGDGVLRAELSVEAPQEDEPRFGGQTENTAPPEGTALYTEGDFVRVARALVDAGPTAQSETGVQENPSILPEGWDLSDAWTLYIRAARLALHMVEQQDVVAFAAPSDLDVGEVYQMCFRLAEGTENGWARWLAHDSAYAAGWMPAWTNAALRALRTAFISEANAVWRAGWRRDLDWKRRDHGSRMLDSWLWRCVDAFVRESLRGDVSSADEPGTHSPYRVLYRGEAELMERWRLGLWAREDAKRLFAADGWLLRRLLARAFVDTGWREAWLDDQSGRADCHLEFEVVPPPLDRTTGDWELRYVVVHNVWPMRVPLAQLWASGKRQLQIGREVLIRPDDWILPTLLEAGRHYPPILHSLRQPGPGACVIAPEDVSDFAMNGLPTLRAAGFDVRTADFDATHLSNVRIRVQVRRGSEHAQVRRPGSKGGQGWFDADQLINFDWTLAVDDEEITSQEFQTLVEQRTPYVRLGGSWKLVPIEAILAQLNDIGANSHTAGAAQFSRAVLIGRENTEEAPVELEVDFADDAMDVKEIVRFFLDAEQPQPVPPPSGFHGTLRHYQQKGYEWLLHLRQLGCGACLADDMGLGKTIQVLAYLLRLKEQNQQVGTHLLICPTSLLQNWRAEIGRFTPELQVHVHHGTSRNEPLTDGSDRLEEGADRCDLVMTTYAIAVRDADILHSMRWDSVIADEAQNIKNADTKQARAVQKLQARHRIALTGTPVENRLEELWSIFHFVNPGYLGGLSWFRKKFASPVDARPDSLQSRQLHRLIRPLLLRRSKSDPAIQVELPEKWEVQEYASLTSDQAVLYQSVVNRLFTDIDLSRTDLSRRGRILAALVRLKQICDHPCLIEGGRGDVRRSGKLALLLELLEDVIDEGSSALVFTQFRDMGELLCDSIAAKYPWRPKFLHGGLNATARGKMVDDFQGGRDPSPVLVLSLKAGGVGLNLTRANYVFHFDRWWNPAVEDQATDRVFRIGQTKNVQVYKLICAGTLEERIDQLITSKRKLSAAVVGDHTDGWITDLDDDALRELFALSVDATMEEETL